MVSKSLIMEIKQYVPEGERSDFANEAFEEALTTFRRKKAFENIAKFRKKVKLDIPPDEFRKLRSYGRE